MTLGSRLGTGHVLDERYILEGIIGQGGMGTVFAARHLELGESVAVKVLQTDSAAATLEAEHLERFLREARLAARIKNEHVVRVIDVARGKGGSPPYIVMERLEGCDLGELIDQRGRLPYHEAVLYLLQACEALAEAHANGVVHRDLKSSNLHLGRRPDGSPLVKVLDFGISKVADEGDVSLTSTSSVFGSPAYMSPEQIRSAKHVDARADIWSLAIVLYELIAGALPFTGSTATAMLAAISVDPPLPFASLSVDVPPGLERAIQDALVKDREQRTQTVLGFANAIAPFAGPAGESSLAAIRRVAMSSQPILELTSTDPPGTVPMTGRGRIEPVSDTIRASDPVLGGVPSSPPAASARARTGPIAMAEPLPQARRGSSLPLVLALVGIALAVCVVALGVTFVVLRPRAARSEPEHITITETAAPPALVASAPPPVLQPATSTVVPSATAQSSKVRPSPKASASAQPGHDIFHSRQ